jgi:hypothetical protein
MSTKETDDVIHAPLDERSGPKKLHNPNQYLFSEDEKIAI